MTVTEIGAMTIHPAAELFPLMGEEGLRKLAADIAAHGLHHPILLLDGAVLDGRNRLRACEMAGVEPEFTEWDAPDGASPMDHVISLNMHLCRELTRSQKALIAVGTRPLYEAEARESQRFHGGTAPGKTLPGGSQGSVPAETAIRAAEAFGIDPSYVYNAARLLREAPELAARVAGGELSVDTAVREMNGTRKQRVYIKDKHAELVKRADSFAHLIDKWTPEDCLALSPPEARKQLTILNKAAELLASAISAVEYRAATLRM